MASCPNDSGTIETPAPADPGSPNHGARAADAPAPPVSFAQATRAWLTIGLLSFGGPIGQIAVMHRIVVDERRWISERRFSHGLNFCMLLPGPEAMQLATYIGWLMHRTLGGIVAGLLFVMPGALVMLGLSIAYVTARDVPAIAGLFWGLKPAVLAIVGVSMYRLGRRTLRGPAHVAIALAALILVGLLGTPFPLIIALAGVAGSAARLGASPGPGGGSAAGPTESRRVVDDAIERGALPHTRPSARRAVACLAIGAMLTLAPVLVLVLTRGADDHFARQGAFYARASVMTFGGAYAVLSYVAQYTVSTRAWLSTSEMMDGLGLAETTPGPLILVVQFTAFVAAHHHAPGIHPIAAGTLASLLVLWVTFVPSFTFVLAGGPYVERLLHVRWLAGALAGVTAAVVGIILHLALTFGAHTLFAGSTSLSAGAVHLRVPVLSTFDLAAGCLAVVSVVVLVIWKRSTLIVIAGAALAGAAMQVVR
ncbi:MAG: chromate efflux transporter [Phycisphaerales bacterium]